MEETELTPPPKRDAVSTRTGAEATVARIKQYWLEQGYRIDAWVVRVVRTKGGQKAAIALPTDDFESGEASWGVRSNLVNGLPPGYKG